MSKRAKPIGQRVVLSQSLVDEQCTLESLPAESTSVAIPLLLKVVLRRLPLPLHISITQRPEANTPALKNDNFNG